MVTTDPNLYLRPDDYVETLTAHMLAVGDVVIVNGMRGFVTGTDQHGFHWTGNWWPKL